MLVDTCAQGKDITNVQTRGMLALLATCILSDLNNGDAKQMINKCMDIVKNLEERVHEKNCELYK